MSFIRSSDGRCLEHPLWGPCPKIGTWFFSRKLVMTIPLNSWNVSWFFERTIELTSFQIDSNKHSPLKRQHTDNVMSQGLECCLQLPNASEWSKKWLLPTISIHSQAKRWREWRKSSRKGYCVDELQNLIPGTWTSVLQYSYPLPHPTPPHPTPPQIPQIISQQAYVSLFFFFRQFPDDFSEDGTTRKRFTNNFSTS